MTKGQLTTEVWNGRAVTDDSLVQCIGDIRRALGDEKGHRLRTVRGRGYILELEGTETNAAVAPGAVATQPTTPQLRIGVVFAAAAAFAATMAVLVWMLVWKGEAPVDASSFLKLTSSSAIELRPSLSPDGRWLMFDALTAPEFDDDSQIYLQPVSGGAPVCVTCGTVGGGHDGAFSPRGDLIAYALDVRGGGILVVGRDGTSPRRLTAQGYHPAWSPDGRFIAYSTRRTDWLPVSPLYSTSELWVADVDSGNTRHLDVGDARDPAWSPDGRRIAFWAQSKDAAHRQVFVVDRTGDHVTRVTAEGGENWHPTWSPDGRTMYFVTNRTGNIGLWSVPIDAKTGAALGAGRAVTVPTSLVAYPRMGADGNLVYADASADRNVHLLSLNAEKAMVFGPVRPVTQGTDFWMMPRPSPKGDWLVLARAAMAEQQDVFAIRRDGSGLRRLTHDAARDGEPEISPDERTIAFESNRAGLAGIWLMDADGGRLRQLTPPSDTTAWTSPRWSPDGRTIAARQHPGNPVVLLDASRPASPPHTMLPIPDGIGGDPSALLPLSLARMAWSPDSRELAARVGGALAIYSIELGTHRTATIDGAIVGWPPGPFLVLDQWSDKRLAVLDTRTWQTREIPYAPHLQRDDRLMLSADGRTLVVERGTYHADIWLMRPGSSTR